MDPTAAVDPSSADGRIGLPSRVLVIEASPAAQRRLTELLVDIGLHPSGIGTAGSLTEARRLLTSAVVDGLVLNLDLPDASGLEAVTVLSAALPGIPLVVVSSDPTDSLPYAAMAEGADEVVTGADLGVDALRDALQRATQRRRGSARSRTLTTVAAAALEAITSPTATLDGSGRIVAVNQPWSDAAVARGAGVGVDYLTVCDLATGADRDAALAAAGGIRSVLSGEHPQFSMDYECAGPDGVRWYTLRVSPTGDLGGGAVVTHLDITDLKEAERQLQGSHLEPHGSVDRTVPIFVLVEADGRIRQLSDSARAVLAPDDDAVGRGLFERLDSAEAAVAAGSFERARRRPGGREHMLLRFHDVTGRWRTLDLVVVNLLDDPSVGAMVVSGSDVTEGHRRQVTRRIEAQLLRRLPAAVIVTDDRGNVVYWNDRATSLYGYSADEVLGRRAVELRVGADGPTQAQAIMSSVRATGRWEGEYDCGRRDGTTVPVHCTLERIDDPDVGFSGIVGTSIDISERRQLEQRLAFEAYHDALTGLPNRRALVDHLDAALARSLDGRGHVAVLYIDLDDFKVVNDSLSHEAGDEVLRVVSRLVAASLRPGDMLARLGGDEFVVCAERCGGIDEALHIADRIVQVLSVPFLHLNQSVSLAASIGVALSGVASLSEELLRDADIAMYEAKESGKRRAVPFDDTLRNQLRRARHVAADLDLALDHDQIVTYFQPEVDIATGALLGFEALARWEHPTRGLVPPDQFIAVAEETGLIERLGAVVLRDACRALATWSEGRTGAPLVMAVNVSARQLQSPTFVDTVLRTISESGVDPRQLCIEITESTVADAGRAAEVLGELRRHHVPIAIDDFGTGYSSLHRLGALPLDHLKIDRSFVARMSADGGGRVIVTAVVGLARALGLGVIAEGVEHPDQASELLELGCTRAQGYMWSRPVPFAAASAIVDAPPWLDRP